MTVRAAAPCWWTFWVPWRPPCWLAAASVEKGAAAMAGRAIVLEVDTERHPERAVRFPVRGVPSFAVFRDGRIVSQRAGLVSQQQMQRWLEQATVA